MIVLYTTDGERYELDDEGFVTARSNGPKGWDYRKGWRITGFAKRAHSARIVPLAQAVQGADIGHGYICDWDHGTFRRWMGSPGRCAHLMRQGDHAMSDDEIGPNVRL